MSEIVVGIFVGGESRRMGSPKGLLPAPDGRRTVLDRLCSVVQGALPAAPVVLLGTQPAYAAFPLVQLPDAVPGAGPIGGLLALVRWARDHGLGRALALACDMPRVTAGLVTRLANHYPSQTTLAARVQGRWQPFFARYEPTSTEAAIVALLAQRRFSMSGVLDALSARPLPLAPEDTQRLVDWDTPSDMAR